MSQPLVLAIEPDLRQAAIVKRIVREQALADVAVVDSRDAAIEAMRTCMPDVLLLSALMSPRDEDELIAHLKTLENAGHLQTHTIPQLASTLQPGEGRGGRGLLSAFRKKKDLGPANGCDPDLFADEIRVFLKRAAEKKLQLQDSNHAAPDMRPSPASTTKVAVPEADGPAGPQTSSWSSPFEWKPGASWSRSAPNPEPPAAEPVSPIASFEPLIPQGPFPIASAPLIPEPQAPISEFAAPVAAVELATPEPVSVIMESAPPPIPEPVAAIPEPLAAIPEPPAAIPEPPAVIPEPPAPVPEARKRGSGFRIRDPRIRDAGLVALGLAPPRAWLRREAAPETAEDMEDVRALLAALAVPPAIASVTYPRGCRIRRVRVPAIPESESADPTGAVMTSGRAGADHRDRRPSV